jgi:hypothetical protein
VRPSNEALQQTRSAFTPTGAALAAERWCSADVSAGGAVDWEIGEVASYVVGLANLAILLFFMAVGLLGAARLRLQPGVGVAFGFAGWIANLASPDRMRVANLWLLAVVIGVAGAAFSGAGYGRTARRSGGPWLPILAIVAVVLNSAICWMAGIIPVLVAAGLCHILGVILATRDMAGALEAALPGSASVGPAIACIAVLASFSVLYLPAMWPPWPWVQAAGVAGGFALGYASTHAY